MTDIAGESQESRAERSQLETQLGVLVQGLETCKRFMVETLHGKRQIMLSAEVFVEHRLKRGCVQVHRMQQPSDIGLEILCQTCL